MIALATQRLFLANGTEWAAALSYYAVLSMFPLLLAAVSVASYLVEPMWAVKEVTAFAGDFLPEGSRLIRTTILGLYHSRGTTSLLSLGTLLWTGSRVFAALTTALNVAFDVEETLTVPARLAFEMVLTVTLGFLFVLALTVGYLFRFFWVAGELDARHPELPQLLVAGARAVLLLASFTLIYRVVPRGKQSWRACLVGACAATLLFLLARPMFVAYVRHFSGWNLIYGSLAIVIGLLVWAWLVALITLFGGELAAHVQAILIEGQDAERIAYRAARR